MSSSLPWKLKIRIKITRRGVLFGYVHSKRKDKEVVGSLCGDDGVMIIGDGDKAEVFNTFFALVFSHKEKHIQLGENQAENTGKEINCRIAKEVVQQYWATLNKIKSPGPDELHPRVERIVRGNFRTVSNYFLEVLENEGSPYTLEESKRGPYFQKGGKRSPQQFRDSDRSPIIA